jgi:thioredoxin reductase
VHSILSTSVPSRISCWSGAGAPTLMRDERSGATRILHDPLTIISAMSSDSEKPSRDNSEIVDAVMVGGGIAGLSAALFLARAGRSTIVYDAGRSRIFAVERIREFVGFDDCTPEEMLTKAREEVLRYGAQIRSGTVTKIEPRLDGLFEIFVSDVTITARSVVLANGLIDELPPLKGLRKVWGRDLRICPCFDGNEVRNQRFVVFGLPERLVQLGSWVSMWSPNVRVVTNHPFDASGAERLRLLGIEVVRDEVIGLVHQDDRLVAVSTQSGAEIPCDAAWIASRLKAASDLAAFVCDVDDAGFAKTDEHGRTSRPGVFAIGNSSNPIAHLAHAAASGTEVGPWVTMHLLESLFSDRRGASRQGGRR